MMPRVVQMQSNHGVERVTDKPGVDSSDSDDGTLNIHDTTYNQRIKNAPDPIAGDIRFAVNYSLYTVEYSESESDPNCLKCIKDGQEIKFKKDSRTWLHKSSEKERKINLENRSDDSATELKNSKQISENLYDNGKGRQYLTRSDFQLYRPPPDVLRSKTELIVCDISSLADSDADLTNSEESSCASLLDINATNTKAVRFDDNISTLCKVHTVSSCSDESLNNISKATSTRNLHSQDEDNFDDFDSNGNGSRNHIEACPLALDVSRIAPAITMEAVSFQEGLLDSAVNLHSRPQAETRRTRSNSPQAETRRTRSNSPQAETRRTRSNSPEAETRRTRSNSPEAETRRTRSNSPKCQIGYSMFHTPHTLIHKMKTTKGRRDDKRKAQNIPYDLRSKKRNTIGEGKRVCLGNETVNSTEESADKTESYLATYASTCNSKADVPYIWKTTQVSDQGCRTEITCTCTSRDPPWYTGSAYEVQRPSCSRGSDHRQEHCNVRNLFVLASIAMCKPP